MNTPDLVEAASRIAAGMAASAYGQSVHVTTEAVNNIARLSVQIARKIEVEARNPHPEGAGVLPSR